MIDFFNAKALAASESRCTALERELIQLKSDLALAKSALRTIDEQLYKASQGYDQSAIIKQVAPLIEGMEHRRRAESNRISSIMFKELNR